MRIRDILHLSWDQVKRRKVVTGLCAAGLSIGCAAIIVALSIGDSAQKYSEVEMNRFLKMDEITVTANGGVSGAGGGQMDAGLLERGKLTEQKLNVIRKLPNVKAAAPFQEFEYQQMVTADNRDTHVKLIGTDLDLLTAYDNSYMQGGSSDLTGTVVLSYGATLGLVDQEARDGILKQLRNNPYDDKLMDQYRNLNRTPSVLYQRQIQFRTVSQKGEVRMSMPLRVVGVLKKPTGTSEDSASYDKRAYVSLETAQMLQGELNLPQQEAQGSKTYNSVVVKVDKQDAIKPLENQIQRLTLSTQTNLHYRDQLVEQFGIVKAIALGVGVFILIIASISIIVAMTMSTYQRRRQIGIMKVLGANLRQIRNMFIVEAALLGLLGGMLGVLFSYWIVWGINALINSLSEQQESIISIPAMTVFIGILFAVMTGVLSGIYPAVSASRTDALTAIRRD